ncbi:MAG: hypothetical protein R3265_01045 [Hyphomonas sp.]|nr:hypothetical protein [Hyphomonas sp.]
MSPAPDPPDYAVRTTRRKFRRIKLGLFLSSFAACLGVTLIGLAAAFALSLFDALLTNGAFNARTGFLQGVQMATMAAMFNFILFFITVPAAWLAMGLSIGRFPHRGISARAPYLRWAAIWGAILVGATTGFFGLVSGPLAALGALLTGVMIGALAGLICGALFHAIVKPAEQLREADISVF